jgi:hypothetical protein
MNLLVESPVKPQTKTWRRPWSDTLVPRFVVGVGIVTVN